MVAGTGRKYSVISVERVESRWTPHRPDEMDYALILREADSIDGQVNGLLESIGETLDRHAAPGQ